MSNDLSPVNEQRAMIETVRRERDDAVQWIRAVCEELVEFAAGDRAVALQTIRALKAEVLAYRHGGVTEELLRRQNGYVKVGKGCILVREADYDAMEAELTTLKNR